MPNRFEIPPEVRLALGRALLEVGRVGGKAIAAGVQSITADIRGRVSEVDEYLKEVERKAKEKSHEP